ncbi:MAG: twin-arginine translocation signal domain-containing protein, partial [Desulfobacterales bacterium]|nr:twin-arginine translocation signal domain-containing protein [Desulfobacterales bacterium]
MKVTRREFIKRVAAAGAITCAGKWVGVDQVLSDNPKSQIFRAYACPVHDGQMVHRGLDTLLDLLAENGLMFYRTNKPHQWGGPAGIIAAHDVVLIKVNCQWKCRGTTNTDVLRGLIYRILQHP